MLYATFYTLRSKQHNCAGVYIKTKIAQIYKSDSWRVRAALLSILGDYELAEESLQEAFTAALQRWPDSGLPQNPVSWLISAGKFKGIDSLRRRRRTDKLLNSHFSATDILTEDIQYPEERPPENEQLRLVFYCCHPLLPLDARIALALRDVCGMKTEEIARAYLLSPETIKKRISRAKILFRDKKIPFEIPAGSALKERLYAVLHVIYLIFNEGYSASVGEEAIRRELSDEAIFLCRKLVTLLPDPESLGLLALLLLQESRRISRTDKNGDLIPLEQQDRSLWDKQLIHEGLQLLQQVMLSGRLGAYSLQAAIASVHAQAPSTQETGWELIIRYYDMLLMVNPSPLVQLNRAIALAMLEGPAAALAVTDSLLQEGLLSDYHLLHAARADFFKRLGQKEQAVRAFEKAISLASPTAQQRYLQKQLAELTKN